MRKCSGMYTLWLSCHVIGALLGVLFLNVSCLRSVLFFFTAPLPVPFQCPSFCELQHCHVRCTQSRADARAYFKFTFWLEHCFLKTRLQHSPESISQCIVHLPAESGKRWQERRYSNHPLWQCFFGTLFIRYTLAAAGSAKFYWTAVWCGLGGIMGSILHSAVYEGPTFSTCSIVICANQYFDPSYSTEDTLCLQRTFIF